MRRISLLILVIMLSCVNVLIAQTLWDNSACLYQSNNTKILLRGEISTGSILFYEIDDQVFLNKFTDVGAPTLDEPLCLGSGYNFEQVLKVIKCDDDKYLLSWREADNLKVQKFDEDGIEEWTNPIAISISNFADYTINESALMSTETQINLAINYSFDDNDEKIIHYQIDFSTGTPQISTPVVVYEGTYIRSLNGLSTQDGVTLMWVIPNEATDMLSIYKDGVIYQTETDYGDWVGATTGELPRTDTGKIIELNDTTTVFALNSTGPFTLQYVNSGLFIFSEVENSLTSIPTQSSGRLMGAYKISNEQFLAVSMNGAVIKIIKYDEFGNVISTTNIWDCPFSALSMEAVYDQIRSVDATFSSNTFKMAMASVYKHYWLGVNRVTLSVITYNTDSEEYTSEYTQLNDTSVGVHSSERILLSQNNSVSLLHSIDFGTYKAYKQYSYPCDNLEDSEATISSYQIYKNYNNKIDTIHSFLWQENNHLVMKYKHDYDPDLTLIETDLDQGGDLLSETVLSRIRDYKFHEFSQNNGLLHYTSVEGITKFQKAKLLSEDGLINTYSLVNAHSYLPSIVNATNGNGWFVYVNSDYDPQFHRIENNILQESPVSDLNINFPKGINGNYIIFSPNGNLRVLKLNDDGSVATDWDPLGVEFYTFNDYHGSDLQVNTYGFNLIVSYLTDNLYRIVFLDPENVLAYQTNTIPSNSDVCKKEFVIGDKFYFIQNYNNNLTMSCYDLDNYFAELWQIDIADNVSGNFDIKKLNNKFVIAYSQGEQGSKRVNLKTISFMGYSDQYENGFVLPLNLESQYRPVISVVDDNTVFVSRVENNTNNTPGVYCDLIDLSYFVPNSSEEVSPITLRATNYPNPFNPETTISYNLPKAGPVKVEVYNLRGQLVKTLVNEVQAEGNQKVIWKGYNNQDKQVSSGIYLYKIKTTGDVISGKMVLMK